MTASPQRVVLACGVVPTLAVAALCLVRPAPFASLEYGVYDRLVRLVGTQPPAGRVVVVDVDEASLDAVGQWPWPRDVIARLVRTLRDHGAIVALDVMFAEADRRQPASSGDAAFAATLRGGGVVLGFALTFEPGAAAPAEGCAQHAIALPIVEFGDDVPSEPFFHATRALCNVEQLTAAARAAGFLNAAPDFDGILRRVPLLLEFQGRVYPSLALAAVAEATGARPAMLRIANVNASALVVAGAGASTEVPLDGKSNLLVRYRGVKDTFPHVSAIDILNGQVPGEQFQGAIAFVGTTALGTREVVATPLDTLFTGLEVQATVADNLLQRDFYRKPSVGPALETLAVLCAGLLASFAGARWGFGVSLVASAALVGATWGMSAVALSRFGLLVSPLFPTLGLIAAMSVMTTARAALERRRADSADRDQAASRRLMVHTLLSLVEMRDPNTGRHSRRTQRYARVLAEALMQHPRFRECLAPERVHLVSVLAPLHDIGKVAIPDAILNKPGPLTPQELVEIRRHPAYGREVIENAEQAAEVRDDLTLAIAKDIVYTHHERWDGTGYPQRLRGTDIPVPGRLMAVVDVYDAMRSPRPYKAAASHDDVMTSIVAERGKHFDPDVVDACVSVSEIFRALSEAEPADEPRVIPESRTA